MVLHHLPQPDQVFRELNRVTRPEGQLLLVELDTHTREDVTHRFGDVWMGFTERDLTNWLEEGGWWVQGKKLLEIGLGLRAHFVSAKKIKEIKKESR
jgi:SAM-dependent methyltransferase